MGFVKTADFQHDLSLDRSSNGLIRDRTKKETREHLECQILSSRESPDQSKEVLKRNARENGHSLLMIGLLLEMSKRIRRTDQKTGAHGRFRRYSSCNRLSC